MAASYIFLNIATKLLENIQICVIEEKIFSHLLTCFYMIM